MCMLAFMRVCSFHGCVWLAIFSWLDMLFAWTTQIYRCYHSFAVRTGAVSGLFGSAVSYTLGLPRLLISHMAGAT